MYYTTTYHECGIVDEGAPLFATNELPDGDWEECTGYADAWLKTYRNPSKLFDFDDEGNALVEFENVIIPCRVHPPGTHPGGNAWWLNPANHVYVPRQECEQ